MRYKLSYSPIGERQTITLNGSKSISNRVLIIRALAEQAFDIKNLSNADDTTKLDNLIRGITDGAVLDAGAAGTTFRFLTAYLSFRKGTQTLTGSARMKQRPIKILVDALVSLGARIEYLENEGYPPLSILPAEYKGIKKIKLSANVSSQYISALMLIAPYLSEGLSIQLSEDIVSLPYLLMTKHIMEQFGAKVDFDGQTFEVMPGKYQGRDFEIEGDWSAASYYYTIVGFSKIGYSIKLKGLHKESVQGDQVISDIGNHFGIETIFEDNEITLTKVKEGIKDNFNYNFVLCPDLAQSVSVMMAGLGVEGKLSGLRTLRIKETDRINALQQELSKVGIVIKDQGKEDLMIQSGKYIENRKPVFDTYEDHRMAMSLSALGLISPIEINEPAVVAKSYPLFWDDLEKLGFKIMP